MKKSYFTHVVCWLDHIKEKQTTWVKLHNGTPLFIIVSKCHPAQPAPEDFERELQQNLEPHGASAGDWRSRTLGSIGKATNDGDRLTGSYVTVLIFLKEGSIIGNFQHLISDTLWCNQCVNDENGEVDVLSHPNINHETPPRG